MPSLGRDFRAATAALSSGGCFQSCEATTAFGPRSESVRNVLRTKVEVPVDLDVDGSGTARAVDGSRSNFEVSPSCEGRSNCNSLRELKLLPISSSCLLRSLVCQNPWSGRTLVTNIARIVVPIDMFHLVGIMSGNYSLKASVRSKRVILLARRRPDESRQNSGIGAPVASIGGAGTLDGVFLVGIVAVLLASMIQPDARRAV